MARRTSPAPQGYRRHPNDPNLVRRVTPQSAAESLYPYLPTTQSTERLRPPPKPALGKGLLSDAERKEVSQLGGVARPAQPKAGR
jgi:hypothetical protein